MDLTTGNRRVQGVKTGKSALPLAIALALAALLANASQAIAVQLGPNLPGTMVDQNSCTPQQGSTENKGGDGPTYLFVYPAAGGSSLYSYKLPASGRIASINVQTGPAYIKTDCSISTKPFPGFIAVLRDTGRHEVQIVKVQGVHILPAQGSSPEVRNIPTPELTGLQAGDTVALGVRSADLEDLDYAGPAIVGSDRDTIDFCADLAGNYPIAGLSMVCMGPLNVMDDNNGPRKTSEGQAGTTTTTRVEVKTASVDAAASTSKDGKNTGTSGTSSTSSSEPVWTKATLAMNADFIPDPTAPVAPKAEPYKLKVKKQKRGYLVTASKETKRLILTVRAGKKTLRCNYKKNGKKKAKVTCSKGLSLKADKAGKKFRLASGLKKGLVKGRAKAKVKAQAVSADGEKATAKG